MLQKLRALFVLPLFPMIMLYDWANSEEKRGVPYSGPRESAAFLWHCWKEVHWNGKRYTG
jgi:hypothetical protein